jgi:hypothetical protein
VLHNLPAAVTLTGTALVGTGSPSSLFLTANQIAVWLNKDDSATSWSTLLGTGAISSGLSLTSDSTYNASLLTVMGSTAVNSSGTSISGGITNLNLANGITTGDQYAVLVFDASTTTTIAGDTYNIWRASDWLIPADGSTISYSNTPAAGGPYQQIRTADYLLGSGTVAVPEPSSASLLAIGVAGLVALRIRRRS